MRTNIEIDDALIAEVMVITGVKTKREAVNLGLRRIVDLNRQAEQIRSLRGIGWEGDLDAMRRDR